MKLSRSSLILGQLYLGIVSVVVLRAVFRYVSFRIHGIPTDMPATRGLLTAPLLALMILAVALIVELIIGYFDREQRPGWHFILIGMSYGSLLTLAKSVPVGIAVVLAINPVTARWLLRHLSDR